MNQSIAIDRPHIEPLTMATVQSRTIDLLRFPMALAVVFIHVNPKVFALSEAPFPALSPEGIYNIVTISISHVLAFLAVPTFFVISGLLFFLNINILSWGGYLTKLRKRTKTLLIPYLLWNILPYLFVLLTDFLIGLRHDHGIGYLWEILSNFNIHILWDSSHWNDNVVNIFGMKCINYGPYDGPLWFVRNLIVMAVCSPLIYWIVKKTKLWGLSALFILTYLNVNIPVPGMESSSFFYFSLGAYFALNGKNIVTFAKNHHILLTITALGTFLPSVYFNGKYTDIGVWIIPFFILSGIFLVFYIAGWFTEHKGAIANRRLVSSCFIIYAMHGVFFIPIYGSPLTTVKYFTERILPVSHPLVHLLAYLIVPFITAALCVAIHELLKRFTPRLAAILSGSR